MTRETFALGPTTVSIVAATETATVLEVLLEPGAAAGAHTHTREDETIVVLDGALVVEDGARRELAAYDAHVLPRGVRHSFANESAEPARALFFCSPGGLERFFREAAAAATPADAEAAAERAGLILG